MRTTVKIFGVLTSLTSLTLMSGLSFAAQTTTSTLTAVQKAQAARIARQTENINTSNGYVSVNASVLAQHGLSPQQVSYVEDTINTYDTKYGLTPTSPAAISAPTMPLTVSPTPIGTLIWQVWGDGRYVILSEGSQDGLGWQHMLYWHNWKNLAAAQNAVAITVHQPNSVQSAYRGTYYFKKFTTTVPFMSWWVTEKIVVGNANSGEWNGYVKTGYPDAGNDVRKDWHGRNESINPWWINVGQYAQKLN